MASITATCITQRLRETTRTDDRPTGIDKAPVPSIHATASGVAGDSVLDTVHHGGVDKALYAYADEDAAFWAEELNIEVVPGLFGENVRTHGIDLNAQIIGTRLRFGAAVVEVCEPRTPCATFQHHMDDRPGWVKRFTTENRTGAYMRVTTEGHITPGDTIEVLSVPTHGVSIAAWFGSSDPSDARALLEAENDGWQMGAALRAAVDGSLTGR